VLEGSFLPPDHLDGKVLMLFAEEGEVVLVSRVKELLWQDGTISDKSFVDATPNVEVELAILVVTGEAGHTWLLDVADVAQLPEAVLSHLTFLLWVLRTYQPGESKSIVRNP
jgi:hypothetical protein